MIPATNIGRGFLNFGPRGGRTPFDTLTADTTTGSTVLAPLLSVTLTNAAGREALIGFTCAVAGITVTTSARFQLRIDGVDIIATSELVIIGAALLSSAALSFRTTGLAAGAHTIEILWAKIVGAPAGVIGILAVTSADTMHASLWAQEVRGV